MTDDERKVYERRASDTRMAHLESEVGALKADISSLATGMQHISGSLNDLKTLVLADKSQPVNVTGWIGIALSAFIGVFGAASAVGSYIYLSQKPIEVSVERLEEDDNRMLDRMITSMQKDAASEKEQAYLRENYRDLRERVNALERAE